MASSLICGSIDRVREISPLVHCITNGVTSCRCADSLHAVGASPIMASSPDEVRDVVARCSALCINIGTPDRERARAMMIAGAAANELDIPVVLDPVGAGVSDMRREMIKDITSNISLAAIRGNASEIRSMATGLAVSGGLDSSTSEDEAPASASALKDAVLLARSTGAVVAVTGAVDIVTDARTAFAIRNGSPAMRVVTGAGCMLSAIVAAFVGVMRDDALRATVGAISAFGICGESASARLGVCGGATLASAIIDDLARIGSREVKEGARVEEIRP